MGSLVVLTVVTMEAILPGEPYVHHEDYALALEKMLIQDCKQIDPSRLANKTLQSGGRDRTGSIGYPLYMAFKVHTLMYMCVLVCI